MLYTNFNDCEKQGMSTPVGKPSESKIECITGHGKDKKIMSRQIPAAAFDKCDRDSKLLMGK